MAEPYVSILLEGAPRGKGRPRFRIIPARGRRPAFASTYTDGATREYEALLAAAGRVAMTGLEPLDEAMTVLVEAFMPIPESWSRKKQAAAIAGDIMPVGKPDADNIGKMVDALNEIVWRDDSAIVMLQVQKFYSEFPRLRVSVWKWNDVPAAEPELF